MEIDIPGAEVMGLPFLSQIMFGVGQPSAAHVNCAESPTATYTSLGSVVRETGTVKEQKNLDETATFTLQGPLQNKEKNLEKCLDLFTCSFKI